MYVVEVVQNERSTANQEEVFDCALTTVIMLAKERYGWNRHEWDLRLCSLYVVK